MAPGGGGGTPEGHEDTSEEDGRVRVELCWWFQRCVHVLGIKLYIFIV